MNLSFNWITYQANECIYQNKNSSVGKEEKEKWNSNSKERIQERIKLGRNIAYAFMGTGLHGSNGLNPIVSREIVQRYVIPRMLYGLESQVFY